jgi:glycosyltransferase involved in cell wall biosynthesis
VDVSVVMSTYNRAPLVAQCLQALTAQILPPSISWEVIVVDNNCTDDTPAVVERARGTASVPVRYVLERRQGVAFGRNTGVEHARGRILAFTDDDVLPPDDWIATMVSLLREHEADIIGGRVMPRWAAPVPAWITQWLEERNYRHTHLGILAHPEAARLEPGTGYPPIWTANAGIARQVFLDLGGFDTRLGRVKGKLYGGEDTDLVRRGVARGFRAFYDPRLTVWHRIPAERMTRRHFRRLRFDDAEGEGLHVDPPTTRALLGVRLYTYRRVATNLTAWLRAAALRRRDAFALELALHSALGQFWGELKAARRRHHSPGTS